MGTLHYIYKGPVMLFDRCIQDEWTGQTWAVSEEKARSNLAYTYKKYHNMTPNARITLPGKIKCHYS